MQKNYIGKNRTENLDWLLSQWLPKGPPICFLEGFAGVGKTDLARDFRALASKQGNWQHAVIDEVADRPTSSLLESMMELSEKLSQQGLPEMEEILLGEGNPNIAFALEKALRRPVVIILDESQRFFLKDSGSPLPEWNAVLAHLRNRPSLPGRLLLSSDRIVERARWSEAIPIRTLAKLEPEEALEVFNDRLESGQVNEAIAPERKQGLVRVLDYNPRAIEALVSALAYDTLDAIIGSDPDLWDVQDREVSREFLDKLERELLERTMAHLDAAHQQRLLRLAVHRKSFKKQALEIVCGSKDASAELRVVLVTRFLLNHYGGTFALNPIVREISLARLREKPADFQQAHSSAADYHLRPFKAKQTVGSQTKLGGAFAELRYHLVHAQRNDDLREVMQHFTNYLKSEMKLVSPVPTDREELDERIGVLSILLEEGGAKGLEYHLAQCLKKRGRPGDLALGLIHAERATGHGAPATSWVLRAQLEAQTGKIDVAVETIYKAVESVSKDDSLFSLYQYGGKLLAQAGHVDDALLLLRSGIVAIPADKGLVSLYQSCADLLGETGKTDEAMALLKEGIQRIPADKSLFSLYQSCAELLGQTGKTDEAVALLKEGIQRIPADKSLFSLYQALGEIYCRAGKPREAIACQREGFRAIPDEFHGYKLGEAALYLCLASGNVRELNEILTATKVEARSRQQIALGEVLKCQDRGDWSAAAKLAKSARVEFSYYLDLAEQEAFSRLANGEPEAAHHALTNFPNLGFRKGEPHGWLAAFIQLRRGQKNEAEQALASYLGRPVEPARELNVAFLLRLWDQREEGLKTKRLCFSFPILPPSLTGLDRTIRRIPFSAPVLPVGTPPKASPPNAETVVVKTSNSLKGSARVPDAYVSYAWGEDTTEDGRRREKIVDHLCEALRASGREIGRDKERISAGDSIERFAQEISKAQRVIVVISEKFLRSDYCMVYELFQTYRRCGFVREEFQTKVIALVMDDAKPILNNNLDLTSLAKEWKDKYEVQRRHLEVVDPDRISTSSWSFLNLIKEMCPRLPDMLALLRDIVMKRGFDEIVADSFQEVLKRLPLIEKT